MCGTKNIYPYLHIDVDERAHRLRVGDSLSCPSPSLYIYIGRWGRIPLVRVEMHLLELGVSVSPLVALISIELHSLGLGRQLLSLV